MRVSKKTDYALRALFTLVEHSGRGPIPIRELSRRNDVPKKFLEQILLAMKKRGWVESLPGLRGGYVLAKAPDKITMGEVVRHFDGILAPIACVSTSGYKRCSQEPLCRFRRVAFRQEPLGAQYARLGDDRADFRRSAGQRRPERGGRGRVADPPQSGSGR